MEKTNIRYGCEVCKHKDKCEDNPFGICKEYEEAKDDNEKGGEG